MIPLKTGTQGSGQTLVLTSLLVVAVSVAAVFYFLKESEKGEKIRVQREMDGMVAFQKELEGDLHALRQSEATLNEKARFQEESINALTIQLQEQSQLRRDAEQMILTKEADLRELRRRLQGIEEEKRSLEDQLQKQYEDYYEMKTQLGSLLKTKEELEQKTKELAETGPVSLGTVVVRQNPARN